MAIESELLSINNQESSDCLSLLPSITSAAQYLKQKFSHLNTPTASAQSSTLSSILMVPSPYKRKKGRCPLKFPMYGAINTKEIREQVIDAEKKVEETKLQKEALKQERGIKKTQAIKIKEEKVEERKKKKLQLESKRMELEELRKIRIAEREAKGLKPLGRRRCNK